MNNYDLMMKTELEPIEGLLYTGKFDAFDVKVKVIDSSLNMALFYSVSKKSKMKELGPLEHLISDFVRDVNIDDAEESVVEAILDGCHQDEEWHEAFVKYVDGMVEEWMQDILLP